ncbi:MAG: DUF11 domain-containing protein [Chloroflexota bacterium]|nr:DUF11 domain-containing protein [Chloroflexota bacterium]
MRRRCPTPGVAILVLVALGLIPLLISVAAPLQPKLAEFPNPLVVVSNEGQAGTNVDLTLVRSSSADPASNWRERFFNPVGWQDAYPVMRASAWTTSTDITPLLDDGADHIWGGTPAGPLEDDAGNSTEYGRRFDGADYDNGYPIPANPSPQYLFVRKDFCLPINAQANVQRRLTSGGVSLTLLNATDSDAVPDGPASVWLNTTNIGLVPGDESGSTTVLDIPDPNFLYRGRNTLAMRAGDARSDARAAILYRAAFDYAIDPAAITVAVNTTTPFEGEVVQFSVTTDGLSGRSPYDYNWTFGDGDGDTGSSLNHTYLTTGTYTVTLTIADTEACTGTTVMQVTVLPHPLTISKTAQPNPVTAGESLLYRITVQNSSLARALTQVVVTDTLPTGTTFSFCSGGCTPPTLPDRTVQWTLASLGPGASATLDLYVSVDLTASGTLTNAAYGVRTNEVYTTGVPVPVQVLPPPCLKPLTDVSVTGPTNGITGTLYAFTGVITPADATEPVNYTWSPAPAGGQGTANASYQWATPGLYTLTLTAENCGGIISTTHIITISSLCPRPLTGVGLSGPANGATGTLYAFTGVITPADATQPVTYTWAPDPASGQGTANASYQWATSGLYTLTLTAENCGGPVSATHAISISAPPGPCPRPLTGIGITGSSSGYTDTFYTFAGISVPTDATQPVTYTWAPAPAGGQGTANASYQWATPGLYTLTLTAENCGGPVSATHTIAIETWQPASVYVPVILRNFPADAPDTCPGWSLSVGQPYDEDMDHADDDDWFTFQATAGINYTIRTQDLQIRADTTITLYDATCANPLAENDDLPYPSNSRASQIEWLADATGSLHVQVRNYERNVYGPDTGYSLVVYDEDQPPPPINDAPDFCTAASPIPISQPYTEDFDHANDNDWFVFVATGGQTYTITTGDLAARSNTILELWDGDCSNQLAQNDDIDYPSNVASQIVWQAAGDGQLFVKVRHHDWTIYGTDTGYTVIVEE